ncbi:ABC transporter ATP-binding protein [Spirillospora sp. CA-108201]
MMGGDVTARRGEPVGITVERVSKSFGDRTVLDEVDVSVDAGRFLAIVGESGGGKSTLLRVLAGLETPDSGRVQVGHPVSIAFQDARLMPWRRVWQNVAFGLRVPKAERRERALEALDEVGLTPLAGEWPGILSGGEAQRAALARALVHQPSVLLLDEPFGALDALTRLRMHDLLRRLWRRHGFTIALVTHDVDEALVLADQVAVIGGGRIADSFEIDLPHPRTGQGESFNGLRRRLLERLGVPSA